MPSDQERAVILVSGGMDSIVVAALALEQYSCSFLHIDYKQRTEEKERKCFEVLVEYYQPEFSKILDFSWLGEFGGSALTDEAVPMPSREEQNSGSTHTYVPFRNTVMLSAAVAWAEVLSASTVWYGAVEVDRPGYPDCRAEYVTAFNELLRKGTAKAGITLIAPLLTYSKKEIVELGREHNVPFELSWSCYSDAEVACGQCSSCILRRQAFWDAGLSDPIPYR